MLYFGFPTFSTMKIGHEIRDRMLFFGTYCGHYLISLLNEQVAWIMSGFIPNFCIPMQPVINGLLEVGLSICVQILIIYVFLFNTLFLESLPVSYSSTDFLCFVAAFAELLDNSLDEVFCVKYFTCDRGCAFSFSCANSFSCFWWQVCNGATYSNIDMLINRKDGSRMLLIEGI